MSYPARLAAMVFLAFLITGETISAANAPEHVIKYRQNLMTSAGAHLANVVLLAQGRVDLADGLITSAQAIVELLENSRVAFPEGTADGDTRARAKIWEERARFDAALEDSLASVRELAAAARDRDLEAVNAALVPVARGCRSCHLTFRVRN